MKSVLMTILATIGLLALGCILSFIATINISISDSRIVILDTPAKYATVLHGLPGRYIWTESLKSSSFPIVNEAHIYQWNYKMHPDIEHFSWTRDRYLNEMFLNQIGVKTFDTKTLFDITEKEITNKEIQNGKN